MALENNDDRPRITTIPASDILPTAFVFDDASGAAVADAMRRVEENYKLPPHERFVFSSHEEYGQASVLSARQWLRAETHTQSGVILGREYPDPAELPRVAEVMRKNDDVDVVTKHLPKVFAGENWLTPKPQKDHPDSVDLQKIILQAKRRFARRRISETLLINNQHVSPAERTLILKSDEELFAQLVATEGLYALHASISGSIDQRIERAENFPWSATQHRRLAQSPPDFVKVTDEDTRKGGWHKIVERPRVLARVVRPNDEVKDLEEFIHTCRWLKARYLLI